MTLIAAVAGIFVVIQEEGISQSEVKHVDKVATSLAMSENDKRSAGHIPADFRAVIEESDTQIDESREDPPTRQREDLVTLESPKPATVTEMDPVVAALVI